MQVKSRFDILEPAVPYGELAAGDAFVQYKEASATVFVKLTKKGSGGKHAAIGGHRARDDAEIKTFFYSMPKTHLVYRVLDTE